MSEKNDCKCFSKDFACNKCKKNVDVPVKLEQRMCDEVLESLHR